jgi:hypothetical protein
MLFPDVKPWLEISSEAKLPALSKHALEDHTHFICDFPQSDVAAMLSSFANIPDIARQL